MLRAALGLELDGDVGQAVVAAVEAVVFDGAAGPLDVHCDGVRASFTLRPDLLDLILKVVHRDLDLWASNGPRPDAGDPIQMHPDAHHNTQLYTREHNSTAALFLFY